MNRDRFYSSSAQNLFHSVLLLGAMVVLLAWIGRMLLGSSGIVLALFGATALLGLGRFSPRWVLRAQRARQLSPRAAPELHGILRELARRAELRSVPELFLVPSPALNAFAVGNASESAIGVTRGLLSSLNHRELAGVLAHEVSHIRNRDLWVMGMAQLLSHMTRSLSLVGQVVLLLSAPALLLSDLRVPWAAVLLLIAAPTISALLQLALSRTREFEADLGAARLTSDPMGLASALNRLEARQGGWWRVLFPVARRQRSSMLDSHPATAERVARLRSLVEGPARAQAASVRMPPRRTKVQRLAIEPLFGPSQVVRLPRWYLSATG